MKTPEQMAEEYGARMNKVVGRWGTPEELKKLRAVQADVWLEV